MGLFKRLKSVEKRLRLSHGLSKGLALGVARVGTCVPQTHFDSGQSSLVEAWPFRLLGKGSCSPSCTTPVRFGSHDSFPNRGETKVV